MATRDTGSRCNRGYAGWLASLGSRRCDRVVFWRTRACKRELDMDQVADIDLDALSDSELDVLERKIANKYMRIVPWGAVVWGICLFESEEKLARVF